METKKEKEQTSLLINKYIENTTIEGLYTLKSMRSLLESSLC